MKILLLITTYNRFDLLLRLLQNLQADKLKKNIQLLIFDDGSTDDNSEVINYLKANFKFDYFRNEKNEGKISYWKLINAAYKEVQHYTFNYFIQLPDDVTLVDDFLTKTINVFKAIKDKQKCCLNILNDHSRNGKSMWTKVKPEIVEFNNEQFYKTGWMDMCFIANKLFFELLDYSVHKVETMFLQNKKLSSGVGCQISKRIIQANGTMYQVMKSHVIHGSHDSRMHPEVRKNIPLITNNEKVTASLATIPTRVNSLLDVINSMINQVDHIDVYLNNFTHTPHFLHNPKITYYHSQNEIGDLGDAGKFYTASKITGYHLTIDDDLIYPSNYVKEVINSIEKYDRQYIVTFHGRKFIKKPVKSYYKSAETKISCLHSLRKDELVDVPGTGVMGYHTNTINFKISNFEASNMADIWASKKAKAEFVPIIAIKHNANWIKHSKHINYADTIYANLSKRDEFQTDVLNSFI